MVQTRGTWPHLSDGRRKTVAKVMKPKKSKDPKPVKKPTKTRRGY